uniref:Mediator complex subunit 23 n=1 Tax=Myotis myotis TaxID=51298 RepID=A0A7J7WWR9_MYOMY|nr:mediator complex subunit 23 [Myotis myotis]
MMGERANSCGSISRVSSFSLCFSSLQVFHIWSFLFIKS